MDELGSQLWPIHLKPRQGELLSSWMIRLAHGHGYKTEKMCGMLFGRQHAIWCRDIDKLAPDWVLSKMSLITGTPLERAVQSTLPSYAGLVAEEINSNGNSSWIVPANVYHRQRTRPGLMYCPICLKTDEVPFFRRIWRLAFVTTCSIHGVNLLDACPECGAAVIPHRVDIGPDAVLPRDRSLIRCWKCGHDLRTASTGSCSPFLLTFTKQLQEIVGNGFATIGDNLGLHSVLYFAGLRVVVRFAVKICGLKSVHFERMSLINRRTVMSEVSRLIASWPVNFLDALVQRKTKYSNIASPNDNLPFWIEKCVHKLKQHQRADWTSEEIVEVARVIESRHGRLNGALIRSKYGVYLPCERLPPTFRSSVSDVTHETLMAALDQSVAATFDPKKRFAFLQDKVMFCLFRFTEMSTDAIHNLKVTGLAAFTVNTAKLELAHAACNREEAFQRLQVHVKCERAMYTNAVDHPHVFFSPYTGRALTDSGIQMRFQKAVRQAFLTAAVPSMSAYKVVPRAAE
jgi:hypothetical protein